MFFNLNLNLVIYQSKLIKRFNSKWSVIFFGTDNFSINTLENLQKNFLLPINDEKKIIKSLDVYTTNHLNKIGIYCKNNKINYHLWPDEISPDKYDIGIAVSFGKLISEKTISSCKKGIINAHASLLPKLRGAGPIFRAILNDYKETGVTIMKINPHKFDTGNLLLQKKVSIDQNTHSVDLYKELSLLSSELVLDCLLNLDEYLSNQIKQDLKEVTLAPKIKEEECEIKWNEMSLSHIYKMYRAFNGFFPIYSYWIDGRKLILSKMQKPNLIDENNMKKLNLKDAKPGSLFYSKKEHLIFIKCKDGWAGFNEIHLTGHSKISAHQFNNGFLVKLKKNSVNIILGN